MERVQKVGEKTLLGDLEVTQSSIRALYRFMYIGTSLMEVKDILHDIYIERTHWDPEETWPSCIEPLSLEDIKVVDAILKCFTTTSMGMIPEIQLLYLLSLEYDKLDILETIVPSEDLFAHLDHVFPNAYRYNLPFVVKFYHALKEKQPFNTIRFGQS